MTIVKNRIIRKKEKHALAEKEFVYWLEDFRGYLLEADFENIDINIIIRQFKRRLKRLPRTWATVTRLHDYIKWTDVI